ncbi:unnamed protein product [Mytilus coruscus]|uniref:Uncharacterized protein n=1 Tax=Mytilus coruscus TaxID=42192 RepID=A0A6J8AR25_MYTCO|nr:unnamed protein product [Mytilus coruscus]
MALSVCSLKHSRDVALEANKRQAVPVDDSVWYIAILVDIYGGTGLASVLQHDQCIIDNGTLNETFGEYSPQNSGFVRVFTEVGTPSQQKVNNVTNTNHEDDEFSYTQPSQESVYVPQQEFIAKLDYDLADLPKETYISKLIEKTNNSDDCLTWYRSTLASRAKSIQGCPTGKLYNRKSTTKSTSTSKYARDCYIIYMFLQGDKTQIDEVFRKDDNKLSVVEHNSEVDYERKSTQNDAKFKVLSQSTKTLDDFDLNNFQQDIKTMNSELDRHNKLQSVMQKSLNELKLIVKPSYASITSPVRASGELNVSKPLHSADTNKSQMNEHVNVQTTPGKNNGTEVTLKESDHLSSPVDHSKHFMSNPELDQLTETSEVPNKDQLNFKIPVRVQGNTEEIKPLNKDIFVGVTPRKRSSRYYLSGIDNKSTRSGILQFLEVKGVNSTFLQLFHGKYNYSRISAKLNVTEESASIIETEAFWPAGVRCRRWLNNHDWQNRCNETP